MKSSVEEYRNTTRYVSEMEAYWAKLSAENPTMDNSVRIVYVYVYLIVTNLVFNSGTR
jgi:hypothetical protein